MLTLLFQLCLWVKSQISVAIRSRSCSAVPAAAAAAAALGHPADLAPGSQSRCLRFNEVLLSPHSPCVRSQTSTGM